MINFKEWFYQSETVYYGNKWHGLNIYHPQQLAKLPQNVKNSLATSIISRLRTTIPRDLINTIRHEFTNYDEQINRTKNQEERLARYKEVHALVSGVINILMPGYKNALAANNEWLKEKVHKESLLKAA